MAYTLVGSVRSPYVRICRLLLIQSQIEYSFRALNFVEDPKDASSLAKETPINRVPILIDGDQKIFDSRVIVNHLTRRHHLRPLSLDEENLVSTLYSCLETGVTLFLLRRDGFDLNSPGFYLSRQRARIPAGLEYVTPWAKELRPERKDDWNYVSMALFSFLYWAAERDLLKTTEYPELAAFMTRFETMPGVAETGF